MPFDAAAEKLKAYFQTRGKDPGPHREARGWYADQYGSLREMQSVWDTATDNATWKGIYGNGTQKQKLGPLGAARRRVGWTSLGRRDHFAQFFADNGKQLRAADLRVRYPMLRARWSVRHVQRIVNIIKRLAGLS